MLNGWVGVGSRPYARAPEGSSDSDDLRDHPRGQFYCG
jgi:hypothetical protein